MKKHTERQAKVNFKLSFISDVCQRCFCVIEMAKEKEYLLLERVPLEKLENRLFLFFVFLLMKSERPFVLLRNKMGDLLQKGKRIFPSSEFRAEKKLVLNGWFENYCSWKCVPFNNMGTCFYKGTEQSGPLLLKGEAIVPSSESRAEQIGP